MPDHAGVISPGSAPGPSQPHPWLQPRPWVVVSAAALGALLYSTVVGLRAVTVSLPAECVARFGFYDFETAGRPREFFPFSALCAPAVDLVPAWVNSVFALAAVVYLVACVMAYLLWADPGGVVPRVVAPAGATLGRAVRRPRVRAVAATLTVGGLCGVALGFLLLTLGVVLYLYDGGTFGGLGAVATPGERSLLSRVLWYGGIGAAVLVEVAVGRAVYRSVLASARRRR